MFFDSVGGRTFHVVVKSIAAACIVYFAVRSLFNTIDFTSLAYPAEEWTGIVGGLFIQFSPNVFFALASYSADPIWKGVWMFVGIAFTGIDAGTNIGDRKNTEYINSLNPATTGLIDPEMALWANRLGYVLDVAVTGAEELFAFFIGMLVKDIQLLYEMKGQSHYLPNWLIFVDDAASRSRGGSGRPHDKNQQKQHNQHNRNDNGRHSGNGHHQGQHGNNNGRRDNVRIMDAPDRGNRDRVSVDELLNRRD